jgi:hypothetical protein
MDLHIHFPIRLHAVMLNSLSTGTTLQFTTSRITSSQSAVIVTDFRLVTASNVVASSAHDPTGSQLSPN